MLQISTFSLLDTTGKKMLRKRKLYVFGNKRILGKSKLLQQK